MSRKTRNWIAGAASAALCAAGLPAAHAGNDIYFVAYNHHMEKGGTELMVMTDLTAPAERTAEVGTYLSNMLELDYGVSGRFATELMLESFYDLSRGFGRFTGFRWGNRYRLYKEENRGLNPMLYMEYENLHPETRFKMELSGREDGKGEPAELAGKWERILETRLCLSRDYGPYNFVFNWINETDMRRGGFTDFGYAAGVRRTLGGHNHGKAAGGGLVRHSAGDGGEPSGGSGSGTGFYCPMHPQKTSPSPAKCPECGMDMTAAGDTGTRNAPGGWRAAAVGLEMYGGLGNSRAFGGPFAQQQHYLQPIIVLHPGKNMMLHIAAAIGLNAVSDDLIRTGLGFEF